MLARSVFNVGRGAAECEGHIVADEKRAIEHRLEQLQVGPKQQAWVREAIDQPLSPDLKAQSDKKVPSAWGLLSQR